MPRPTLKYIVNRLAHEAARHYFGGGNSWNPLACVADKINGAALALGIRHEKLEMKVEARYEELTKNGSMCYNPEDGY